MNQSILFDTIQNTVQRIDNDLRQTNENGIYFAPELFIGFTIGQDILLKRKEIFGTEDVQWQREVKLPNGGFSDIVFTQPKGKQAPDHYTVIELKLRSTYDAYRGDIEKLLLLKDDDMYSKFFCVLLDSFTQTNDERLEKLEKDYPGALTKIGHLPFKTVQTWYKKQIFCNLNLYRVK